MSATSELKEDDSTDDKVKLAQQEETRNKSAQVLLRRPVSEDGADVHQLIADCPPLDTNSLYCNLLQACHFSGTSVAAELDGKLVGFISGYIVPERPDTLFIWQVAVAEQGRGMGLAGRMLREILARPACADVRFLETTITPDNDASWALFRSLARKLEADCADSVMFDRERHFRGQHDSEMLLRIGPFDASRKVAG
ncbi:diaminobutyrate acetyltransferase [Microbulbifer hydrolyticus]|uniref:L-2,4-diaminobutyric acid acetyltransferase n=1 Tax=Microbulbifer hydrolyticus TaxID=48074 RepID=A0AA89T541_9GAMM|nr:diaminobutyrate acetyltransferase [Microbulbifer hydrolyticus]MBB5211000.1 L-2,4-diaminobutyric acid acetyltransferase [Microbulbifer hydrolyticus]